MVGYTYYAYTFMHIAAALASMLFITEARNIRRIVFHIIIQFIKSVTSIRAATTVQRMCMATINGKIKSKTAAAAAAATTETKYNTKYSSRTC